MERLIEVCKKACETGQVVHHFYYQELIVHDGLMVNPIKHMVTMEESLFDKIIQQRCKSAVELYKKKQKKKLSQ